MKRTVVDIISVLFMILFLYTGISKLLEITVFEEQLRESFFKYIAPFISWALPLTEIAIALLLLFPKWKLQALYFSLFLMIGFTAYVIWLVSFTEDLPCSCGGVLQELSWRQHIVFNCAFVGLAIFGIKLYKQISKEDSQLNCTIVHSELPPNKMSKKTINANS